MTPEPEEYEEEETPDYPTAADIPDPSHHRGPVGLPQPTYDADMLNFLQQTVSDTFYPHLMHAIDNAAHTLCRTDSLGGVYSAITQDAVLRLKFLADKYINPSEYVVTNVKDNLQFRAIINDYRIDAANAKTGLRRIDYNNTFMSFLTAMENHLKGAKLTRSFGGFERVAQQTQRAELSSTYEQKKQTAPSSGLNRLLGKG